MLADWALLLDDGDPEVKEGDLLLPGKGIVKTVLSEGETLLGGDDDEITLVKGEEGCTTVFEEWLGETIAVDGEIFVSECETLFADCGGVTDAEGKSEVPAGDDSPMFADESIVSVSGLMNGKFLIFILGCRLKVVDGSLLDTCLLDFLFFDDFLLLVLDFFSLKNVVLNVSVVLLVLLDLALGSMRKIRSPVSLKVGDEIFKGGMGGGGSIFMRSSDVSGCFGFECFVKAGSGGGFILILGWNGEIEAEQRFKQI